MDDNRLSKILRHTVALARVGSPELRAAALEVLHTVFWCCSRPDALPAADVRRAVQVIATMVEHHREPLTQAAALRVLGSAAPFALASLSPYPRLDGAGAANTLGGAAGSVKTLSETREKEDANICEARQRGGSVCYSMLPRRHMGPIKCNALCVSCPVKPHSTR